MNQTPNAESAARRYPCSGCGNIVAVEGGWCGGCSPAPESMTAREVIVHTLTNEGGAPGNSLHSWRCEHPDRYGECDCLEQTADEILAMLGTRDTPPAAHHPDCSGQHETLMGETACVLTPGCPHGEDGDWHGIAGDFLPCVCCGGPVSVLGNYTPPPRCENCPTTPGATSCPMGDWPLMLCFDGCVERAAHHHHDQDGTRWTNPGATCPTTPVRTD